MSKTKKPSARKLSLDKKRVRNLTDDALAGVAGAGPTVGPQCNQATMLACACPTGNRCCANHNQQLRRR